MSAPNDSSARPARRPARRPRAPVDLESVTSGASEEVLSRPAGELLDELPWAGVAPDPDLLDAATFLAWL